MLHLKIAHNFLHVKQINDVFVDKTNHIYLAVPMCNLIGYSDNYSDTLGSLWQFKREEPSANNPDLSIDNSELFIYKAALFLKKQQLLKMERAL